MSIQLKRGQSSARKQSTIVLEDGQPFFEKDTKKLYVGDGTKKISELKYVGQEVDDSLQGQISAEVNRSTTFDSSHNNIENGSGTLSVQQVKNTSETTIPINTKNPNAVAQGAPEEVNIGATGESSAVFGGAAAATAKRSFAAGTNTVAIGKYSAAFGDNSVALGNESFAAGYATVTKGAHSAAFGESTQALADNVFIAGQNSKHEGMNGASFGQSNIGHFKNSILLGYGVEDSAENQVVIGSNYKADSDALFQVGVNSYNCIKVDKDGVLYAKNQPYSINSNHDSNMVITPKILPTVLEYDEMKTASFYQSILIGRNGIGHTDIKPTTLSIGQSNTITDGKQRVAVIGNQHSINKNDTVAFGWALQSNNRSDSNSYTEAIFGHYNKPNDNVLLQVGNGTSNLRSNAFEVFNNGSVKVYKPATENNDVLRLIQGELALPWISFYIEYIEFTYHDTINQGGQAYYRYNVTLNYWLVDKNNSVILSKSVSKDNAYGYLEDGPSSSASGFLEINTGSFSFGGINFDHIYTKVELSGGLPDVAPSSVSHVPFRGTIGKTSGTVATILIPQIIDSTPVIDFGIKYEGKEYQQGYQDFNAYSEGQTTMDNMTGYLDGYIITPIFKPDSKISQKAIG